MSDLEKIIRPFQTPQITPPARYFPTAVTSFPIGKLIINSAGTGSGSASESTSQSFYSDTKHKEKRPGQK
jgi:hypothetical protein